jgi:hypothetical protein
MVKRLSSKAAEIIPIIECMNPRCFEIENNREIVINIKPGKIEILKN